MEKTQKDLVKDYVEANPGKTAVQIARATGIRAANVSSVLVKGFYSGMFKRKKPEDAKGWTYRLNDGKPDPDEGSGAEKSAVGE